MRDPSALTEDDIDEIVHPAGQPARQVLCCPGSLPL